MAKNINVDMGKRIKELRKGMTQIELAQRADVAQAMLSRYEKGTIPDAEVIFRLAMALGTSVEYLMRGTNVYGFTGEEMSGISNDERLALDAWKSLSPEKRRLFIACPQEICRGFAGNRIF